MARPRLSDPPQGGKRERNKAENRAAILAAARRVFADPGYEAATIRDVIGATRLAAGTFYNYFPDKESVLRALLDEKMVEMQRRGREYRLTAASVEDIVRTTISLSFTMLAEDRQLFDLLHRNAGAIRVVMDEPSFVASMHELREDLEKALRRDGMKGIDVEYLTAAISGVAFEVAACAVDRSASRMKAAAEFATSLLLGGIAALARSAEKSAASRSPRRPAAAKPKPSAPPKPASKRTKP